MSNIGKPEPETQQRVIALFKDEPGYRFLGGCRLFDSPDEDTAREAVIHRRGRFE